MMQLGNLSPCLEQTPTDTTDQMMKSPCYERQRNGKRLPSWGDPILPNYSTCVMDESTEVELGSCHAEDEMNESIEIDAYITPHILSDPMQDVEMLCLFHNAMESDAFETARDDEYSGRDARGDAKNDRYGPVEHPQMGCNMEPDHCPQSEEAPWTSLTIGMNEEHSAAIPTQPDWSIEICACASETVFNLRHCGGAYMALQVEEIMDSIRVILEDATKNLTFHVRTLSGRTVEVESDGVLGLVDGILGYRALKTDSDTPESENGAILDLNLVASSRTDELHPLRPSKRQKQSRTPLSPWRQPSGSKIRRWPVIVVE